jgi:hypothetical protein
MRVIKSDSGALTYQKIFKDALTSHSLIVVWQIQPETGERLIAETRFNSVHFESGLLHLDMPFGDVVTSELALYCYSEEGQFIFKTEIQEIKTKVFSIGLPTEVKLLEGPDVDVIRGRIGVDISTVWNTKRTNHEVKPTEINNKFVKTMRERSSRDQEFLNNQFTPTLDEEDKLFAEFRETPRARPKIDKFVKVRSESSEEIYSLKLFDLSQGGIGFITEDATFFPQGSSIFVLGFDEFNLDEPLLAIVMSHRSVDDTKTEFKIGCKFDDGQS